VPVRAYIAPSGARCRGARLTTCLAAQPGLVLDIVEDIRRMNDQALKAAPRKTGIIVLGGGERPQRERRVRQEQDLRVCDATSRGPSRLWYGSLRIGLRS